MEQKRLLLALLLSGVILFGWGYFNRNPEQENRQVQNSQTSSATQPNAQQSVESPQGTSPISENQRNWHGWWLVGVIALGVIIGSVLLFASVLFWEASNRQDRRQLIGLVLALSLLAFLGYLLKEIAHFFTSPVGVATLKVAFRSSRIAAVASMGLGLLLNGMRGMAESGGYSTAPNYEWRYLDRQGQAGGRYREATVRDVYEHRHGRGSWDRREKSMKSFVGFLRVVAFGLAVWAPYLPSKRATIDGGCVGGIPFLPARPDISYHRNCHLACKISHRALDFGSACRMVIGNQLSARIHKSQPSFGTLDN